MQDKSLMFYMIRSELEDAVGVENVSTKEIERAVYSVDYFWLSRKWQDAGEQGLGQGGTDQGHKGPDAEIAHHRGSIQGHEDRQLL